MLLQRAVQTLFSEKPEMRAIQNARLAVLPILDNQQLEQCRDVPDVGDRADNEGTRPHLLFDGFEERIMVLHVFNHIVANNQIEVPIRNLIAQLIVPPYQYAIHLQGSDLARVGVGLHAPDFTGLSKMVIEPARTASDLQHALVAGGKKAGHENAICLEVQRIS